jgi:hypothetical protein
MEGMSYKYAPQPIEGRGTLDGDAPASLAFFHQEMER